VVFQGFPGFSRVFQGFPGFLKLQRKVWKVKKVENGVFDRCEPPRHLQKFPEKIYPHFP